MTPQDVVFTALFGSYETLNELEILKEAETRYVCFTDDPKLLSKTWEVILVEPAIKGHPSRVSREIKMLGHMYFPVGTRALYIDNTVRLKVDGSIILDSWLANAEIAFMRHYSRKTVRDEFFICSAYALDSQEKIWSQFKYYRQNYPQVLRDRPHWGGMIARINSESATKFMEVWKTQFDTFSRRDQLSINVSSVISGVGIRTIEGRNDSSDWHVWPVHTNRITTMREEQSEHAFRKLRIIINAVRYGYRFYIPSWLVIEKIDCKSDYK
jgi:hypothetical protein